MTIKVIILAATVGFFTANITTNIKLNHFLEIFEEKERKFLKQIINIVITTIQQKTETDAPKE